MTVKSQPIITIITVVKDASEGLKKTASSFLSQSDPQFEWLVVDGFSQDGSVNHLETLSAKFEVNIFQIPPNGIYNAMNFAAQKARGEWLWFINAGDVLISNNSLGQMKSYIMENSDHDVISTPVAYMTRNLYLFDIAINRVGFESKRRIALMNHQGVCVKKNKFFEINGFDEKLTYAADGKFLDLAISDKMPFIGNKVLVGFEMGGTSSKNFRLTLKEISTYRKISSLEKKYAWKILAFNWARKLFLQIDNNKYAREIPIFNRYTTFRERALLKKLKDDLGIEMPEKWSRGN
jgi:glycosyltransferase involved in cell wall biosynthesis